MREDRRSEYKVVVERHIGSDILVRLYASVDFGHGPRRTQDHFIYADDVNDVIAALEQAMPEIAYLERHPRVAHRPTRRKPAA